MAGPHFCPRCPSSPLVPDPFGGASLVCPLCQHSEAGTAPATAPAPGPQAGDWWTERSALTSEPTPQAAPIPVIQPRPNPTRDRGHRLLFAGLLGFGLICLAIPLLVLALVGERTPPKELPPVAVVTPTQSLNPAPAAPPMLPLPPEESVQRPMPVIDPEERPQPEPEDPAAGGLPALPPVPEQPPIVEKKPEPAPMPDPTPVRRVVGRLQKYSEADLRRYLDDVPEIGLERVPGSTKFIVERARGLNQRNLPFNGPLANLPPNRIDLVGLPMLMGKDCHLGKEDAENLHALSRKLRAAYEQSMHDPATGRVAVVRGGVPADPRIDADRLDTILGFAKDWSSADAIPTMMQMMQAENKPVRKVLIDRLAQISDRRATTALAMRAVTDLSPDLRQAALDALKNRPAEHYRPILLAGLRYPFIPVAEHSAEALVALNDQDSVATLVKLLDEPTATGPTLAGKGKQYVMRELVKVNHLANCALCHQPSFERGDMVRGAIPTLGVAIPGPATTPAYYENDRGDFVRADITYLRQDFSLMQPVPRPNNWPSYQRFDYLVRIRKPTERELATLRPPTDPEKAVKNPSRDAVLFALKELTGKDLGMTSKEWQEGLAELKSPANTQELAKSAGRDWRQFVTTLLPEIKSSER